MQVQITDDELKTLGYFYEHATGFTAAEVLEMEGREAKVAQEIGFDPDKFQKIVTYLESFGLLHVRKVQLVSSMRSGSLITGVGISGHGANYLRQLKAALDVQQPGLLKKISSKTLGLVGQVGMQTAIKLLTDFVAGPLGAAAVHAIHRV